MTLLVFFLNALNLLSSQLVKSVSCILHLLIVWVDGLQSEEAMIFISVCHHVVLHTSCCLSALLVFHNTMALVIDDCIPFCFKKLLVKAEVCKGSDNHTVTTFCCCSSSLFLGDRIQITDIQPKILSILHPVIYFLLAWSNKEDSTLALFGKTFSNT